MNKSMIAYGISMMLMVSTATAGGKNTAIYVTTAKIVDIEDVYKTSKLKRYSNCKTILHEKDGLTGKKTFCDDIEWKTINTGVEHYRVTYELYGKTFSILEKHRPVGRNKRMKVTVTPYR